MANSAPPPVHLASNPSPLTLKTPSVAPKSCSSLLPIPTPNKPSLTSNSPRVVTSPPSLPSPQNSAYDKCKLKPINTNITNLTTTSYPPISLIIKPREGGAVNSKFTPRKLSPQSHTPLQPIPIAPNYSLQKPSQLPSSPGVVTGKTIDELADDQLPADEQAENSDVILPPAIPHSLRRIPRLPRQRMLNTNRTQGLSTASMFRVEPSSGAGWRSVANKATPPPALILQQPNNYSLNRGLTTPHQPRKAKSQQELLLKSRSPHSRIVSAQFTTPVKQASTRSDTNSTSPESLQSNITLTDGDSSIPPSRLDNGHEPTTTTGYSNFEPIRNLATTNVARRTTDALILPPSSTHNAAPSTLDYRVSPEAQSRLTIVEKLKTYILATESPPNLLHPQAVCRLICQTDQYETQQEIEKRVFENDATIFLPQATLEVPTESTPALASYLSSITHPSVSTSQSTATGGGPSTKKLNVGAIILEKLRWVSKNGTGQSFKHGRSKSLTKSVKIPPSPIVLVANNRNKFPLFDVPVSHPDHHRFSQVIGVGLERMHHSTCVVTMGARLHVLPTLPFCVIEEIYRRGMRTPGILRISGNFTRIDELVKTFESCPSYGIDLSSEDIHTLCGLLKYYLRSLPQPLVHPLLGDLLGRLCVQPARKRPSSSLEPDPGGSEWVVARQLLQLLPSRALSLLAYVVPFLAHVPTFSENRIQDESLATMLGPALFISRDIGFPGLGLHPRPANLGRPTLRQAAPGQSAPEDLVYPPHSSPMEKSEAKDRAAESTLWMMNHWEMLFSEVYSAVDGKSGATDAAEPRQEDSPKFVSQQQQQHGAFHGHAQQPLPQPPAATFGERFVRSRPSSIVTYSSGLTGSRRSSASDGSTHSSSSIQSPAHGSQASDTNELEFNPRRDSARADPGRYLLQNQTLSPSSSSFSAPPQSPGPPEQTDHLPSPASDQHDLASIHSEPLREEDKEQRFKQSPIALLKRLTQEEERRERRNSERLTKLLADYIGGREEKISQQESLIESLIEEIGKLTTTGDGQEAQETGRAPSDASRCLAAPPPSRAVDAQLLQKIKDYLLAIDQQPPQVVSLPKNSGGFDSPPDTAASHPRRPSASRLRVHSYTGGPVRVTESNLAFPVASPSDHILSSLNATLDPDLDGHVPQQKPSFLDDGDNWHAHGEEERDSTRYEEGLEKPASPLDHTPQPSHGGGIKFLTDPFQPLQSSFGPVRPAKAPSAPSPDGQRLDPRRLSCSPRSPSLDKNRPGPADPKCLSSASSCCSSSLVCAETQALKAELDRLRLINSKLTLKLQFIESIASAGVPNQSL